MLAVEESGKLWPEFVKLRTSAVTREVALVEQSLQGYGLGQVRLLLLPQEWPTVE